MVFQSASDTFQFALEDRVAVMTLNRPEARNALADEMTGELRKAIAWCSTSDDVGAVLLTGAGQAFCSGGDVKAMGQRQQAEPVSMQTQFEQLQARHQEISGALYALRKPTVAALPGAAAGAGLAIALACDIRFASVDAFASTGYARIGLSGDYGIAWLLTRVVGPARARQLLLTSERITATSGRDMGLFNFVTSADDLLSEAKTFTAGLASGPAVALRYIKDNLDDALTIDHRTAIDREADRLMKCRSTADHKEAVRAFAEKREPVFGR
ncbi:MAG: enoyl-CoA hydratase/isomerase family protein [Pseudomonadales bacterium]|nr:enoyl-CoA hydratase/isomerase family protein [Pseudomonadales bacterium]